MTRIHLSSLVLFTAILFVANSQWFIIKKDYPSTSMNYPNPGKRSVANEELKLLNIDCSVPYPYRSSHEEKTAWILSCNYEKSPVTIIKDSSSSSSSSNSIEDELYPIRRLIAQDRRTVRSSPPYFHEHPDLFNR
ncbi:unnamed protein product [Rotaria magnacalcarata]|uniref:Uncharacterized protein n=1 Tax=Rotaria magnacalcarata TaxID=392030 RepID=A0A815U8Z3_9BILA|nr:unnamed protein product [Rotaria magnacalcarata]CAF1640588.1 unnamed protein product [Rotaria magnacalcarata]CAF2080113.1 unnamed protein product [Rotaria magnacalcarata]CAF2103935.1 unnamed protein product [Rotaria magnacalcarata]CAF2249335.1 unnamed protein product [Rotaria magnacalcarata]